jgi:hypothetical protein
MRDALGQLKVNAVYWTEGIHRHIAQPFRRCDGAPQDSPDFLLHGDAMAHRSDP